MPEGVGVVRHHSARPSLLAWNGVLEVAAIAVVAFLAATFARLFREGVFRVASAATGERSAIEAARTSPRWAVFLVVTAGLVIATIIGRAATRWRGERLGMAAVAAAGRNEGPGPSFRATFVRSSICIGTAASLRSRSPSNSAFTKKK